MSQTLLLAGLDNKETVLREALEEFNGQLIFYNEKTLDQMPVAAPALPAVLLLNTDGVVIWSILMDAWDDIDTTDQLINCLHEGIKEYGGE